MNAELMPRFRIIPGERRHVAGFHCEPDQAFFDRLIRKKPLAAVSRHLAEAIEASRQETGQWVRTAAIYGLFIPDDTMAHGFPGANLVALALVTCGRDLDIAIDRRTRLNDVLGSFLLDAWGSAWVEGAVSVIDRMIRLEAGLLGLNGGKRRSPGYPPWQITDQRHLIDRLHGTDMGISLTDSLMLIPRKSVSFGIPLTPAT
ncbi:hypothetical protein JXA80_00845 [bacterium]|nr:hypothetical protein [candidate division CSSED10-310 bacterium]